MKDFIKFTSVEQKQLLFLEDLLNNTDKITKVTDNSVISAIAHAIATLAGKAEKDIALALGRLFPDFADSSALNDLAENLGLPARMGPVAASGYVRVIATPGTTYIPGTHRIQAQNGLQYNLLKETTIGDPGFGYIKVACSDSGVKGNTPALQLNTMSPAPTGHIAVLNENAIIGGRDTEDDFSMRLRLKAYFSSLQKGTFSTIEHVLFNTNPNFLKLFHLGISRQGDLKLGLTSQSGVPFTEAEIANMYEAIAPYLSLVDFRPYHGGSYALELVNMEQRPFDVSCRVELQPGTDLEVYRQTVQAKINEYFDWRKWNVGDTVDWEKILLCFTTTPGTKTIPDAYFFPRLDYKLRLGELPRLRGFILLGPQGQLLLDQKGVLQPIYYPADIDFYYSAFLLKSL